MTAQATLISSCDYSLHAHLAPVVSPGGGFALTFTSRRQSVRNPGDEQVRFFTCLERDGLEALTDLIQQELRIRREDA